VRQGEVRGGRPQGGHRGGGQGHGRLLWRGVSGDGTCPAYSIGRPLRWIGCPSRGGGQAEDVGGPVGVGRGEVSAVRREGEGVDRTGLAGDAVVVRPAPVGPVGGRDGWDEHAAKTYRDRIKE